MTSEALVHDAVFSAEQLRARKRVRPGPFNTNTILPAVLLAVLLLGWEACVRTGMLPPFLLPAPSNLIGQFIADVTSPATQKDALYTITEIVTGFASGAVLGITLGAAIALIPLVERLVWPYVVTLQTIPKVAIAPLLIIWFGFGIESKILIVALICFFPILVNAVAGFKSTDQRQILLMYAMDAARWHVFLKVRLPSAIPFLIAGFRIAVIMSVIGAVVGEFMGASVGLGSLILRRQSEMDVTGVFSVLMMLSLIGLSLNFCVKMLSARLAFWAESSAQVRL